MNFKEILEQNGAINAERQARKIELMFLEEMQDDNSVYKRNKVDLADPYNRTGIALDGIQYRDGKEPLRIQQLRIQLAYADNIHGINKEHITREQYSLNLESLQKDWDSLPENEVKIDEYESGWV